MKKLAGFLFSARLMAVLLAVFAISIAVATFIENDFGTVSSRALVYNARWFEVLLLLGAINLTGRIIVKKLYTPAKLSIFLFHISFAVIIAGAAITRYNGFEGTMAIREGSAENRILTDRTFIRVIADEVYDFPVSFTPFRRKKLNKEVQQGEETVQIRSLSFIPNAYETIEPYFKGSPVAEMIYADSTGRKNMVIRKGEKEKAGTILFNFSFDPESPGVQLQVEGDSLLFIADFPVTVSSMDAASFRVLEPHKPHLFNTRLLYSFNDQTVVLNAFYPEGRAVARQLSAAEGSTYDAVIVELRSNGISEQVILLGKAGYVTEPSTIRLNDKDIILSYGSVYHELPFELELKDFIIKRYPGSKSPSSFESQVVLIDRNRNFSSPYRIYMNNILKYHGYRFYQSSYDRDERGTILSVNHDRAGTTVTYAGYFLMAAGMVISLLNRKSRFIQLSGEARRLKTLKQSVLLSVLVLITGTVADANQDNEIAGPDAGHAALFGRVLLQDNTGRIEPVNTLSSEVLRKLNRKSSYKGLNPDQVLLGMFSDPLKWQHEPIIRSTHPGILDLLGTSERYHTFASFFKDQKYILEHHVSGAYRKKPALRSKFDSEIIKLDERINICYLVFTGELLRFFPLDGDSTQTWYSTNDILHRIKTQDSVFTNNVLYQYASEVKNGNLDLAVDLLRAISTYQQKYTPYIIPSDLKISTELFLNKTDIFSRISKYYGITGFILLILQFIGLFFPRFKLKVPVTIALLLIIILFTLHSAGLGLRWYVSGHAPWSNGYEALIYVAWATVLAGLIFSSRLPLTLSVSSILAFLTLFVAHLSWMDPQITPLVPVLKSYWLVLHVAIITASYGFLAMGALLAFVNLTMMFLHRAENRTYIKYTVLEISCTIEMSLTIGLYLLSIGVFLGAIWANESWGRYWGWDPKETWALVTVLTYAFVLHMRMIPGLKGTYAFNLSSLLAFSSVIMTYFGVNYYLSGLHSYAQGDPLPVPSFLYIAGGTILIAAIMAKRQYSKLELDENGNTSVTKVPQ